MTPKEKAKELIEKMYYANQPYTYELKPAKQCALILIDEISSVLMPLDTMEEKVLDEWCSDYWEQVKQEIETL